MLGGHPGSREKRLGTEAFPPLERVSGAVACPQDRRRSEQDSSELAWGGTAEDRRTELAPPSGSPRPPQHPRRQHRRVKQGHSNSHPKIRYEGHVPRPRMKPQVLVPRAGVLVGDGHQHPAPPFGQLLRYWLKASRTAWFLSQRERQNSLFHFRVSSF